MRISISFSISRETKAKIAFGEFLEDGMKADEGNIYDSWRLIGG
jgi:hypothetical protein